MLTCDETADGSTKPPTPPQLNRSRHAARRCTHAFGRAHGLRAPRTGCAQRCRERPARRARGPAAARCDRVRAYDRQPHTERPGRDRRNCFRLGHARPQRPWPIPDAASRHARGAHRGRRFSTSPPRETRLSGYDERESIAMPQHAAHKGRLSARAVSSLVHYYAADELRPRSRFSEEDDRMYSSSVCAQVHTREIVLRTISRGRIAPIACSDRGVSARSSDQPSVDR